MSASYRIIQAGTPEELAERVGRLLSSGEWETAGGVFCWAASLYHESEIDLGSLRYLHFAPAMMFGQALRRRRTWQTVLEPAGRHS